MLNNNKLRKKKKFLYTAVSPLDVLCSDPQSMFRPHVTDGVVTLVSWAEVGIVWSRVSLVVWQSCEGLNGMTETRHMERYTDGW